MFDRMQILEKIRAGESSAVEFKEVLIKGKKSMQLNRDALSDEIAAFANHQGGAIIFGVSDKTNQITGVEDTRQLIDIISEVCRDSLEPAVIDFYVDSIQIPDETETEKTLVYVEVGRSLWLHLSQNGYFYRHGNSKRKMSTEQVLRVGQSRSQARIIPFAEQPVPNTTINTLQKELYEKFIPADDEPDSWLQKRRLLVNANGNYHASVAGVLMCCDSHEHLLSNSFIQAVCYRGLAKDANYQIDAQDFSRTLDHQIMDAFHFVHRYNAVSARKNIGREERPQYSMRAVFEALVNAVVHRDYSKHGSKIRLFMFADRLELYSPGELANTLTVDNLPFNQVTRNELLAGLLSEIRLEDDVSERSKRAYFLERRGEGVSIILRESEELSGKIPTYEMRDGELCLTIFAAEPYKEE